MTLDNGETLPTLEQYLDKFKQLKVKLIFELKPHDAMRETVDLNNLESIQTSNSSPIKALTASELMGLIKSLPIGYRTVFNMFAIEGYTHKEISSMLNITESSSRSQLAHARQILQSKVNELY